MRTVSGPTAGFVPWAQISAVSWKEDDAVTLIVISHIKTIARHLHVPGRRCTDRPVVCCATG